jgi:hypothetical protein
MRQLWHVTARSQHIVYATKRALKVSGPDGILDMLAMKIRKWKFNGTTVTCNMGKTHSLFNPVLWDSGTQELVFQA